MRTAFINELISQARIHPEIFLVVGDLGFSVVEPFCKEFPDRFLNAGVAEQNMTGVAAGLASEGYHVFTYSIANFPTLRCFEQIRNDICYHNLPVTVVSVGAGMAYGNLGYSHHAVQDIGVMRTLPDLAIVSPSDPGETRESVQWLVDNPQPSYLRIGKAGELDLHSVRGITSGPLRVVAAGGEMAIASTGSVLQVAIEAASRLKPQLNVDVYSCPLLQPCSPNFWNHFRLYKKLIVLEEHVSAGGLSSLLREMLRTDVEIVSLSVPAQSLGMVGSQEFLRNAAGLSADKVSAAAITLHSSA